MSQPLDTLWYTRCPVPTGLGIAVQQGWLQDDLASLGTQVQSLREADQQAVRESHFDHSLLNSVRHGGSIPAIWARAQGRDTRVIGLSWADEAQLILTRPDSGIHTVKDLKGRRFGLPDWASAQIDFTRAQALRGLENALKLEGLAVADVELVDYPYGGTYSDDAKQHLYGAEVSLDTSRFSRRNNELIGLLRGDIDAIFLKGAHAVHLAHEFGLRVVVDTGSHPDPLIRSNNGTPRTLTVDRHLLENHFDASRTLVDTVLRTEQWAWANPEETRRFLARELNTSEYWVAAAYGDDAHRRLRTTLDSRSIEALQDFTEFLFRWGFIPRRFDVREWIDFRVLEHVIGSTSRLAV